VSTLNVVLVQADLAWHEAAENRRRLDAMLAAVAGADLVVLPEMFASGFTMQPEQVAETMAGHSVAWLRAQAARLGAVVCGSLALRDGNAFVNRFLWATPAGELAHYDKRHLFRMSGEHLHYAAGARRAVFVQRGVRVLPQVCYDLRFPVFARSRGDYDLLVCVANWPAARQAAWDTLLRARAIENQCYVVGVNRVGSDGNGIAYAGGSTACGPAGEQFVLAREQPAVLAVTLDFAALAAQRAAFPAWRDADAFRLEET
jgi:predicted amidohydrolase